MNSVSVSVCIPTYNQAQYLSESVSSACRQSYPNVEVWVSDDASTDETPKVIGELRRQFPKIHYHRQPHNLGIAANVDWVLRQPQTEFIVRLDSDDILSPCYVEKLVKLMLKYPKAGYAHSAYWGIDEYGNKRGVQRLARSNEFQDAEEALLASVSNYRVAANICMFRRKALEKVNFTKGRPDFVEDYDLSVRLADAGWGNTYTGKILGFYRVWGDSDKQRFRRKIIQLKGLIHVYEESMIPAFRRRDWDTMIIRHYRHKAATTHADALGFSVFNAEEKATIVDLLRKLGDSSALEWRLFLVRLGFGRCLHWYNRAKGKIKGQIKNMLYKLHIIR